MASSLLLVTGARGYIGRHVLRLAASAGHEAVAFAGDVLDPAAWDAVPAGVAAVVHLAAASRRELFADAASAERSTRINVAGTEAACRFGVSRGARLVLASTCGVYAPSPAPLSETAPTRPAQAYARSKLAAEKVCLEIARAAGLSGVIFRIFNVYGPFQPEWMLFPFVLGSIRAGAPVALRSPQSVRDHVHVEDAARALLAGATAASRSMDICNVGTGTGVTNERFARLVARTWGRPFVLAPPEPPCPTPDSYVADTRRAGELLGFTAQWELERGLEHTRRAMGA